jgi:ribonuclease HII
MWIAGVDEVGRGPIAGPVIAAAVILDPKNPINGLKDSKKLSKKARDNLDPEIREKALAFAIGQASVAEIDQINILQASLLAMKRAVLALKKTPSLLRIDGIYTLKLELPMETYVGGDNLFPEISAASIIAKVYRDNLMTKLGLEYPEYGFERHAGYPTAAHLVALRSHGPSPVHRCSFAPVKALLEFMP